MSGELISELHQVLDDTRADEECRVVVLTGAGRGFCAGLDLKEPPTHRPGTPNVSPQSRMHIQQAIAALVPKLRSLPQPVIAAVNGPASGGGLALALACDIRIAAPSATFNAAFVRIGLSGCDIGVSWLLPRLIGAGRSHELLLTGRLVDAAEADRIGLVNRVVPESGLLDGEQPDGRLDDQGGGLEPARGRQPRAGQRHRCRARSSAARRGRRARWRARPGRRGSLRRWPPPPGLC
jgi:enoyl-CoA hydratase